MLKTRSNPQQQNNTINQDRLLSKGLNNIHTHKISIAVISLASLTKKYNNYRTNKNGIKQLYKIYILERK